MDYHPKSHWFIKWQRRSVHSQITHFCNNLNVKDSRSSGSWYIKWMMSSCKRNWNRHLDKKLIKAAHVFWQCRWAYDGPRWGLRSPVIYCGYSHLLRRFQSFNVLRAREYLERCNLHQPKLLNLLTFDIFIVSEALGSSTKSLETVDAYQ